MFGAKLSWCQIVRCQIVLVPNCPGAKLSTFIILVPNCLLLLSWCQIVRFIILVPNCLVPNCPVPNCPTIVYIIEYKMNCFVLNPCECLTNWGGACRLKLLFHKRGACYNTKTQVDTKNKRLWRKNVKTS